MDIGETKICARDLNPRCEATNTCKDACQGKISSGWGTFWEIFLHQETAEVRWFSTREVLMENVSCYITYLPSWRSFFLLGRYHLMGVVSFGFRCNVPGFPGKICPRGHSVLVWYFSLITQESTPELQNTTRGSRTRYRKISNLTLSILYSNLIIIKI